MSGSSSRFDGAAERLAALRERIAKAAERAGRDPGAVSVVAVSKTFPVEAVLALARAGQRTFGENRVQEGSEKIPRVGEVWEGPELAWRLIGHLQRNKVKRAIDLFQALDSVDSYRLLDEVAREGAARGRAVPILLQYNCSGEATKGGFRPEEGAEVAARTAALTGLDLRGVMTIGPLAENPEAARPAFRKLREVRDLMEERLGRGLPELSMGMSGDLEIGVEEGATLVRVGTALFGERA